MKKEYSLMELFERKVELSILAGKKLGYDFTKHNKNRRQVREQVREAVQLANKWADEEKWVCVKPCKELKYYEATHNNEGILRHIFRRR